MNDSSFPRRQQQTGEALLQLEGICRRFGKVVALDGISLSVRSGETICLVGQSGCGKSSLLRIIAGVDRPDRGRLVLDGMTIAGPTTHMEPEDRKIGFIFQDYALFPHLDVTDNILFGLKRLPRDEARRRGGEVIERLGLEHLAQRFPHMLSGGEHQRVALARALAPQPRILLMDEPFSNLDRRLRDTMRDETLALLRMLGTTVIMVTHDPEEALSAGDRIVLMRAGQIIQTGTGHDIYDRPRCAYAAEFFCAFNKVSGVCRNGFLETPLGRFEAPAHIDGAAAAAYVRPQCLRIVRDGGIVGRIVEHTLTGEIEQIKLAVTELSEPLRIRSTERTALRPGEKISVAVDPNGVFVF